MPAVTASAPTQTTTQTTTTQVTPTQGSTVFGFIGSLFRSALTPFVNLAKGLRGLFTNAYSNTKYAIQDTKAGVYDYFYGDYGTPDFLAALHAPVVGWQPAAPAALEGQTAAALPAPVAVINPAIPLAAYTVNIEQLANGELRIHATTPRMHMHSISTDPESAQYKRDFAHYKSWVGDQRVMAKYRFGGVMTADQAKTRFDQLGGRFKVGNPYGAMMAYYGDMPVGMFTLGHGERAGEAEFAAVVNPRVWSYGFASEAAIALMEIATFLRRNGFSITNQVATGPDTSPLTTVSGTARVDNYSNNTLRALLFSPREQNTQRYGDGDQTRNVFRESVSDMATTLDNTRRARITPGGTYSTLPRPASTPQ